MTAGQLAARGGADVGRTPVNMPTCRPTPDSNSKILRILSLYHATDTFGRDVAINSFYDVFQGYAKYIQEPDLDQAVIPDGFKVSDNHNLTPSQKLDKMVTSYTSACKDHMFKSPWCAFIKRQIKAYAQTLVAGLQEQQRADPAGKLPPAAELLMVGLLSILYVGIGCLLLGVFLEGVDNGHAAPGWLQSIHVRDIPRRRYVGRGGQRDAAALPGTSRKQLRKRNRGIQKGRRTMANTRKRGPN